MSKTEVPKVSSIIRYERFLAFQYPITYKLAQTVGGATFNKSGFCLEFLKDEKCLMTANVVKPGQARAVMF